MQLSGRDLKPPCYVCDLARVREKYHAIVRAFKRHFPSVILGYSYKTNYVPAICEALYKEGAYAEVVSGLEYSLARALNIPHEHIIFNGTGRTPEELAPAFANKSLVNLDSLAELDHLSRWSSKNPGVTVEVGLRVNVSLPEPLGQRNRSRFGLSPLSGELDRAIAIIGKQPNIKLVGLHAHLSSKARDLDVYRALAICLTRAAAKIELTQLKYVDVGGGYGFAPTEMTTLTFPSFSAYASTIKEVFDRAGLDMSRRTLIVEPGIAIIGDCMSYLASVLAVKDLGDRSVAVVEGSIQTVKPQRHRHTLPTTVLNPGLEKKDGLARTYDLVGYTCMEDDYISIDQELPELNLGDVLKFDNVGAYTLVFKPPFIHPAPAVYTIDGDKTHLTRAPQTFEQFFSGYAINSV